MSKRTLEEWRLDDRGKSLAYFSKKKQTVVSRDMIKDLKKISKENGFVNSRFCLHNDPGQSLQDMILIAYKGKTCKKPHMHVTGMEAMQIIEGEFLAIIMNGEGGLVDKRILSAKGEFAYRNERGRYHIYLPLTKYAILREIRDGQNNPEETIYAPWDHAEVLKKYLGREYLNCSNVSCKSPCKLGNF